MRKESDNIKELITALDRKLERLRGMIQAGSVFKAIPNRLNLILSDLEAQLFEFIARTGIGRDINVGEVNRALNEVGCLELEVNGWLGII